MRWGNSPAGLKALGGPKKVAEWNASTNALGKHLPEHVKPAKGFAKRRTILSLGKTKRKRK